MPRHQQPFKYLASWCGWCGEMFLYPHKAGRQREHCSVNHRNKLSMLRYLAKQAVDWTGKDGSSASIE